MRTEIEEALEYIEFATSKRYDIYAHWTSPDHINWRKVLLHYLFGRLSGYGVYVDLHQPATSIYIGTDENPRLGEIKVTGLL